MSGKLRAKFNSLIPDPKGRYKSNPKDSMQGWRISDDQYSINVIFGNQRDCESMVRELAKRGVTDWESYDEVKKTNPKLFNDCIATALKW